MPDDDDVLTIPEVREVDTVGPTLSGATPKPVRRSPLARYRLGEVIGHGGMGEIVSAKDEQIGRSVAVKRMRGAASSETRTRFLREARIQGRLEHPAVVPVHELATDDLGEPYFVMKQLAGTTLHDVIVKLAAGDPETMQRFTRQRLLRAFADACLAIEFAHTRGVIHRDLKPSNLMLGDFGEVYILDWGVARIASDTTAESFADIDSVDHTQTLAGAVLGTPGYMSPEQARVDDGDRLDGRSDVYALGCILFEILTLQPMHKRGLGGLSAAMAGDQTEPSARAPDKEIPPELDTICMKATMFEPADRHATARELGDAVQAFLDGDRDVELRRKLAAAELVKARAASRSNTAAERRDAMRAAGRALALEPTDRAAAELVARLMLEPPTDLPVEVEREIADRERETLHAARRLVAGSSVTSLGFFPLLIWAGLRDPVVIATGLVCVVVIGLVAWLAPRSWTIAVGRVAFVGWTILTALLAYMLSPFLLAVGVAAIVGMAVAMHPAVVHRAVLFVALAVAALAPWLLGPDSLSVTGHDIVIHAATTWLDPTAVRVGLAVFVVSTTLTAVMLARGLTNDRRAVQRRLDIQSWLLRQLVPETT